MTGTRYPPLTVAVVGGGWSGLSAAVHAVSAGHRVTLFEMSRQWGGRARSQPEDDADNGQHILIGAYRETLALMRRVGVDPNAVLLRRPLSLCHADGRGLRLRPGPAIPAFVSAVLRCNGWTWSDKLRLLWNCGRWAAAGFHCEPDCTVDELCRDMPRSLRSLLIDPLCVAALNTPSGEASAAVFLRVLKDGLFGGAGACDLLLPRRSLHELLPAPATRWLQGKGADLRSGHRVKAIAPTPGGWQVDGQAFDVAVLACSATEAARLVAPLNAAWTSSTSALRFEPIVTVYVHCPGASLPEPMLALPEDENAPAQFVFDHGTILNRPGRFAFVISGAGRWVAQGNAAMAEAVLAQAGRCMSARQWPGTEARIEQIVAERRATFRCTPGLTRPGPVIAPGLFAAGDYVAGPYPATLEGAVRSGQAAALACAGHQIAVMARAGFHDAK